MSFEFTEMDCQQGCISKVMAGHLTDFDDLDKATTATTHPARSWSTRPQSQSLQVETTVVYLLQAWP